MAKGKKGRLKLPKRLLGVKVPKQARKNLNAMLRSVPSSKANPLVGALVASFVTLLVERLEQPLRELIEAQLPGGGESRKDKPAPHLPSQAHH